jgi:hypothetical protein
MGVNSVARITEGDTFTVFENKVVSRILRNERGRDKGMEKITKTL